MKLYLNNFFKDLDLTFFYKLFERTFNTKIELSTLEDSEILFESVFGGTTLLYHKKWLYTILFIGESDRRLPIFMNDRLIQNTLKDYSLILKGETDNINIINLPLFVLYTYAFNFEFIKFKNSIRFNNLYTKIPPKNVCVIVSSRDSEGREIFFEKLGKKIHIDYAGNYKNNVKKIDAFHCSPDFIKFISQYKFIITMENSKNKTYITEKILHGFAANTIPVYWGSDHITDYFNEERFINVKSFNDNDVNDAINKILTLINDNDKYLEIINKPIYKNNKNPFTIDNISNKIQKLLSLTPIEQKKIFITFGGPSTNYHNSVIRICNEARELNFFNNVYGFTDMDLKQDKVFWDKHGHFIENNKKGYGYWIWKSYLIQKELNKINENDILIYCDAGCQINTNGKDRLFEYIDLLNNNRDNYGIISFQLEFQEVSYTKKNIFEHFSIDCNRIDLKQHVGGILLIKKNNHSIHIINNWYNSCCHYNLINDNVYNERPYFRENRHDQSILSVLVNKYGSIKKIDETYFEPNWDTIGKEFPFWAKRIK
jgi:hypothetical protein